MTTTQATKHTPGPWGVQTRGGGKTQEVETLNVLAPFADQWVCELTYCPEEQANARLIAAAPEMLEALKTITDRLDAWADHHTQRYNLSGEDADRNARDNYLELVRQGYEAINKAEGRN